MRANIPIEGMSSDELLEDWGWLLGKPYAVVAMNNFGDMFLRDEQGGVCLLALAAGELTKLAGSVEDFQKMSTEREYQRDWFLTVLLTQIEQAGMVLAKDQCFSFKKPPALGGKMELSNIEIAPIRVHVSLMGQLHRQIKAVPPGTRIKGLTIE